MFDRNRWVVVALALSVLFAGRLARADEVVLKNGDKLNGKIGEITDGTIAFTSPILGAISIKLSDVTSYKTDGPATLQLKDGTFITQPITGTSDTVTTGDQVAHPISSIKHVNPPAIAWTGNIVFNGELDRGNTNSATAGLSGNAVLRRDNANYDDRFTLGADYNFQDTGRGTSTHTTADNYDASAKYDKFFSEKFYGYGDVEYFHDRIAGLNVRLTPGAGVGYQWVESPTFNFNTEGGISYVYEDQTPGGVDQNADFRLAYHLDKKLNAKVGLFNDVEFLAAVTNPADYFLDADAGVRADLTDHFFAQFKIDYKRNDNPAGGLLKDDLQFLLGVGWGF